MPASASAGGAQIGLVLSGSKGFGRKIDARNIRLFGVMPPKNQTGDLPLLPRIFPHYSARTRTRDGALEHAELAPGSDDATEKLAKGRPVDFEELLRIQRHYQCPQCESAHRRRWLDLESRCLVPFTSFSGHYRRQEAAASGSLPRRAALFSPSRDLWTNWTGVCKAKQGEIIPATSSRF